MPFSRRRHAHPLARAVLIAALLAVSLVTLWHHHDDADGKADHHDCAVCAAVLTPSAPPAVLDVVPALCFLEMTPAAIHEQVASPAPLGLPLSRGPPIL